MSPVGFPHSEICGSLAICASPQLIAAYHVLHRLLTPRHPPYALSSLTEHLDARWLLSFKNTRRPYSVVKEHVFPRRDMSPIKIVEFLCYRGVAAVAGGRFLFPPGGDSRDRTGNLRLAKPALSQLSYIPRNLVGLSGLEPLTSRLSGARSNHLSYRPPEACFRLKA